MITLGCVVGEITQGVVGDITLHKQRHDVEKVAFALLDVGVAAAHNGLKEAAQGAATQLRVIRAEDYTESAIREAIKNLARDEEQRDALNQFLQKYCPELRSFFI